MQAMRVGVLVAGVALAGAAVYMVQQYVGQAQAQLDRDRQTLKEIGPLEKVYVVKEPVNYGDPLTPENVQLIYWPKNTMPEGVFTPDAPLFAEGQNDPRYVLRQMEAFEPVLAVKVTEQGETAGLTSMLKPGQRAFAIKFGDAGGATNMMQAGNFVDIYWTGVDVNGVDKTMLIEGSVEVIAVDRTGAKGKGAERDISAPKAMTVAVTQEQVARLTQAQSSGSLSVSLVAKPDQGVASGPVEIDTSIFGKRAEVAAPVVEETAKVCTVRKRVGTEVIEDPIPCTN